MGNCPACHADYAPGDGFCAACGARLPRTVKEPSAKMVKAVDIGVDLFFHGIVGVPILVFGTMFITAAVGVFIIKMMSNPAMAFSGLMWGMIIGGIIFLIGQWIIKQIGDETTRNRVILAGMVIGVVIGITQIPSYLSVVSGFY